MYSARFSQDKHSKLVHYGLICVRLHHTARMQYRLLRGRESHIQDRGYFRKEK
jgi:hypothetical protein